MSWSLILTAGKYLGLIAAAGLLYLKLTSDAYDRGFAARDTQAREQLNRMEARLRDALKKNESLTDDELDCALRRLRQPNAACR